MRLGHPERRLSNVIQIIGSDGKFSVLRALRFFIEGNKQTISTHVSPSLTDIRERFWMGKNYLTHAEIKSTIKVIEKLKIPLTVYEVLTLIFLINASQRSNDYCVQEAGALWRLDSNNVIDFPLKQIVVNINKQHLNFVKKKTLDEIIYQKVGFLNQFTDIYIGKQKPYVLKKIKRLLKKNNSQIKYSASWKLIKVKNNFFYKDKKTKIKLNTKYIHSKGLLENLCLAINIALDLKIDKKIIVKTLPKIRYTGRIDYLDKGKLAKKLYKNERILVDGCHSETSARNLANYLRTLKIPIYGIWAMTKNKDPDKFIKQFKGIFRKIITIPIKNESASLSNKLLLKIAKKNNYNSETSKSFEEALKKITSKERKIICCFGSLYSAGNILNKN
jgi:dihydrofolate synthase/folylpolyglutamate synthase